MVKIRRWSTMICFRVRGRFFCVKIGELKDTLTRTVADLGGQTTVQGQQ